MFVQIIKGKATDTDGLRRQFDDWEQRLKAGATGFLGATGGVTDEGDFVDVVRFESEDAARRNSDRPEQGEWWSATEPHLENVTFTDTGDVTTFKGGGSDDAGFVQVIEATVSDRARYEQLMTEFESTTAEERPDVIGGITAWDGNRSTSVIYFTSEDAAREGEGRERSEESRASDEEWQALMSDVRFHDLRNPMLVSG